MNCRFRHHLCPFGFSLLGVKYYCLDNVNKSKFLKELLRKEEKLFSHLDLQIHAGSVGWGQIQWVC
jgi:hypothetical protein